MKQDELERFVEQLAKAEREASVVISEAEAASDERVNQFRQQLEKDQKEKLEALLNQFDQEKDNLINEIERESEMLIQDTQCKVENMKQINESIGDQLVDWMVDRVVKGK